MEYRDALKMMRDELGVSQTELANSLHISVSTISRWELGRTSPNRSLATLILDYADSHGATPACLDALRTSYRAAARSKLETAPKSAAFADNSAHRALLDDAAFSVCVSDVNTYEILYANKKASKIFGDGKDIVGRKCHECIFCGEHPCRFCHNDELQRSGSLTYEFVRPADKETYCIQCKPIQWNGRDARVEYIFDRGARRNRSAEIIDETPGGIAVMEVNPGDISGSARMIYCNDRFISFSGYKRKEYESITADNFMALVFAEDMPALFSATEKMCMGELGSSVDIRVRCHTKDGGFRWLLITGRLVERSGDKCIVNLAAIDITEIKLNDDRNYLGEEILRAAVETDRRIMIVYNIKENFCRVESRTLYSAEYGEVFTDVPRSLIERGIVSPDSLDKLFLLFDYISKGETHQKVALQLHVGLGRYEWFECNATTAYSADGTPERALLMFHNITEQRIKEAVYRKWQQSINTRAPESYTLFRCNLSNDTLLDEQDGTLLKIDFPADTLSFNERTKLYANKFVHPDDREGYTALLDSDTLLAMFYRGEHSTTLEYRELSEDGEKWRRLTVETVEYLDSSDVQAFLMYEDIDEAKRAEIEAKELAEADPLTGALNRATFADRVDKIISENPSVCNALIMLDMDGFKQLNDTFGHAAGDQALQEVAAVLRSHVRSGDLVCRLGGDEFLVWLRGTPYDAVIARIVQRMCEHIRKAYSNDVVFSASAGIAVFPRDGHDFYELYQNADKALYRVKQKTKGSYAFFSVVGEEQTPELAEALASDNRSAQTTHSIRRRLLIVDDDEATRTTLRSVFGKEFQVEIVKNSAEAMIRLRHFGSSISAVLLDIELSDSDGVSLLQKIQNNNELRVIPVIAITGSDDHETVLRSIELGASEYVTKPIDTDLLRIRVQSVISKAENERLRAQNSYLMLQRDEEMKYRTVLESTGTVVVEYSWRNHVFSYDDEISKYIAGRYDHRGIWQIFLSDMVAESADVRVMQDALMRLANNRGVKQESLHIKLKTPQLKWHWFRMCIYKNEDEYGLAEKMVITFNDVNEEIISNEKLLNKATHDELTGLYNRAGFIEKATKLIAANEPGYYILTAVDIEKFKVINDQYGTAKGDAILKKFASMLEELCGDDAVCCRVMADDFTALYPAYLLDTPEFAGFYRAAEHLDDTIPSIRFAVGHCYVDDKTLAVSSIYDRAAIAKETIKGRYDKHICTFDESMRTSILRQQTIIGQMKHALENKQFEVWLQPQINHTSGNISGAEALVRWRHPEEGIISPTEFIPVFERNGFIYELDKYIWRQVCSLLKQWLDNGMDPVPVSVNISRQDLFREDIVNVIEGLVKEFELPFDLLHLEITETAFAENGEQIIMVVEKLVAAGFTVEIDDFGSGYSSLNTLKDVPAQTLKMDMRFLENDKNAQRGGSIVESVVRMAKWLGMTVIAEGVENAQQALYLSSIGCNYIQGYLYSKPLPIEQFEEFCKKYQKEHHSELLETVEDLNQNSFWDPCSMESLIFNSFVGSACILEYTQGRIEMLRATKHYIRMLGNPDIGFADVLELDWAKYLDEQSVGTFADAVAESERIKETVFDEYVFVGLPGCRPKTVIRGGVRVIAVAGERRLIYCISENITAQREAEEHEREALRSRERAAGQMKAILDNVDVGVVASIIKGDIAEILFANEKYFELLGYTREQFNTEVKDCYAVFAPEERQRAKEVYASCIEENKPGSIEAFMLRRDGSQRLIKDAFSTCRFTEIDEPVQLSIFRDITDERQAELRRQQAADQIRVVMENVDCGICAVRVSRVNAPHFFFANEQFYAMTGYTAEQIGKNFKTYAEIVHPDDRDKFNRYVAKLLTANDDETFEYRCIKRDGSVAFLNCSMTFTEITGYGKVVILVQTDITEMTRSKQDIEHLANQLEVILNNTADAITVITVRDGRPHLIFANNKHYEQIGITKEIYDAEYDGKFDHVLQADRERVKSVILNYNTVGSKMSIEFRGIRADGEIRWIRSNITIVNYPGVEGTVQLAVTSDITEQVEAALKEQQLSAELQRMMAEMPGGFVRFRVDGERRYFGTYCNDGFCKLLGMEHDEVVERYAKNPLSLIYPDDVETVRAALKDIIVEGGSQSARYRLLLPDGKCIRVTAFGRFTHDQNGTSFMNLYFSDETAQEKEARYREMLMDYIPCGSGIYEFSNGRMQLIYQNQSYWELVGLTGNEKFPDPTPMSAVHPDDIPMIMQKLMEAIDNNNLVTCEIRLRHLALGYRPVKLTARIVPEETGRFLIIAAFLPKE